MYLIGLPLRKSAAARPPWSGTRGSCPPQPRPPPLAWPLTGASFRSPPPASFQGRKCQRWAMKPFDTTFTVDFYWTNKQCLCHLDISEKA